MRFSHKPPGLTFCLGIWCNFSNPLQWRSSGVDHLNRLAVSSAINKRSLDCPVTTHTQAASQTGRLRIVVAGYCEASLMSHCTSGEHTNWSLSGSASGDCCFSSSSPSFSLFLSPSFSLSLSFFLNILFSSAASFSSQACIISQLNGLKGLWMSECVCVWLLMLLPQWKLLLLSIHFQCLFTFDSCLFTIFYCGF